MSLEHFQTECIWDHLYVFDGDSVFAPLIAAFSGSFSDFGTKSMNDLVTKSGKSYLYFYSDAAYNMTGFNISYSVNSCPRNCSNHGVCVGNRCTCDAEYDGDACEREICPNNCSNNGECDRSNHRCVCFTSYTGYDCSILKDEGYWELLRAGDNTPNGRTMHQSVIYQDTMFIIGGEYFQSSQFLLRYDLRSMKWDPIVSVRNNIQPEERFGHSVIVFNHKLIMFGGILKNGSITNQIWEFDIFQEAWQIIVGTSQHPDEFCCPIASAGHTATLVGNTMIIIFGYNPTYGYLNDVQHFNLGLFFTLFFLVTFTHHCLFSSSVQTREFGSW